MGELNGVIMQYFHSYVPADGTLWQEAAARARELAQAGITGIWLPPAYKGVGPRGDPRDIEAYTHFHFPGRQARHSRFEWHAPTITVPSMRTWDRTASANAWSCPLIVC